MRGWGMGKETVILLSSPQGWVSHTYTSASALLCCTGWHVDPSPGCCSWWVAVQLSHLPQALMGAEKGRGLSPYATTTWPMGNRDSSTMLASLGLTHAHLCQWGLFYSSAHGRSRACSAAFWQCITDNTASMNTLSLLEKELHEAPRGHSLKSQLGVKQPPGQSQEHYKIQLSLIGQS